MNQGVRSGKKCEVKPLVEKWVSKLRSNYGLAVCTTGYVKNKSGKIKDPQYGYMRLIFASRESKNDPKLVIEYQVKAGAAAEKR